MKFSIKQKLFAQFPGLCVGVVVARGIDNHGENNEALDILKSEQTKLNDRLSLDNYKENEKLVSWREAYRSFGVKPKKYQCSVENLSRMVLQGIELKHINTVVDLYNSLSLRHIVPIGGDDLDHIDGDVLLTYATGEEPFIRLNTDEVDHPKVGEIIYRDDIEVLCRRWNWRECDKSKMTEDSTNVLLVIEGLGPINQAEVESITQELSELVKTYCGGEHSIYILNKESPSIELIQ